MIINNEKGLVLPLVIMIVVVLLMLGVVLMQLTTSEILQVSMDGKYLQAYYIARAGADATASYIENNPDGIDIANFIDNINNNQSASTSLGSGTFTVNVTRDTTNGLINIVSTGSFGNVQVPVTISINENIILGAPGIPGIPDTPLTDFDMALFSNGYITMYGSASVTGRTGTNSTIADSITMDGGTKISGDLIIGPGANINNVLNIPSWAQTSTFVTGQISNLPKIRQYTLPQYPTFPTITPDNAVLNVGPWPQQTYTISSDGYYSSINLSQGGVLTIDVSSNNRIIRVGSLNMPQGFIILNGSHNLTLYVDNSISLSGGSIVNCTSSGKKYSLGNPSQLIMYYSGSNTITIANGNSFVGSIYAQNANIDLSGGGYVLGNVITGGSSVKMSGGSTANVQAIFAPNADFVLTGGGTLYGAVIAKTFYTDGDGKIIYSNSINNFPLSNLGFIPGTPGIPGTPSIETYQGRVWK